MPTAIRWLSRRTARSRGDHAEQRALTRQNVPPAMLQPVPGGQTVNASTALGIADAYACIRALADAAGSLPLIAYRRTPAGRQRLQRGAMVELLARPAPATTQASLIGQLVAHLNLHGNAYVGKVREQGQITQLVLLAPDRVVPEVRTGKPLYTYSTVDGRRTVLTATDVVHVRALSTDGLVGLSPVRQCRMALGLSQSLTEHAARFFDNDARPSGILRVHGLTDDQPLGELWEQQQGGLRNAHRIAVLQGAKEELDFTPLSMPHDDAQFLEQRKLSATEVARIFRVPPWMIGADAGSSMTYSNVESQALAFVTYALRPWLVAIEQALTADPDLFAAGTYCEFLLDALLRADSRTRADVYALALDPDKGWMTRAEVRRLENLDPEPETP